MPDLDRVERDLAAGLGDLASKARPRTDAWERFEYRRSATFLERAADDDDVVERIDGRRHPAAGDLDPTESPTVAASSPMPATGSRRRWPLLASAAAAVAVVVVGVALLRPVADDPSSTTVAGTPETTIELRGAGGDPDAIEAFTAVTAAYEAFNSGDAAQWLKARTAPQTDVDVDDVADLAQSVAAGARYEVDHCNYIGFATYDVEGHPGYPPLKAHQFQCDTTISDAFTTAAGINVEEQFRWLVAHRRVVDASTTSYTSASDADLDIFAARFTGWLRSEHPDSFADMQRTRGFYPPVQDMPAALELLDDFVAADDRYPLRD